MSKKVKILVASLLVAVMVTIGFGSIALAGNAGAQPDDCPDCNCDCGNQYHGALTTAKARPLNRVTVREPALTTVPVCNSVGDRHPSFS